MTAHQTTTNRTTKTTTTRGGQSSGFEIATRETGTRKGTFAVEENNSSSHYIGKYSWLTLLIIIATHKPDTITTNATFSFNGRRLVTSLILVITTIILLVLLVINLDLIKFTEATVNTTSASSSLLSLSTSTSQIVTAATTIIPSAAATVTATTIPTTTTISTLPQNTIQTTTISNAIPITTTPIAEAAATTTTTTTTAVVNGDASTQQQKQLKLPPNIISNSISNTNADITNLDKVDGGVRIIKIILPSSSQQQPTSNVPNAQVQVVTAEKSGDSKQNTSSGGSQLDSNSIDQIQMAATQNNNDTANQNQGAKQTGVSNNNDNNTSGNGTTTSAGNRRDPCASSQEALDKLSSSPSSGAVNETARHFDIDYASKTFEDSMADRNSISLNHYLNGFKELMKFFHSLGTIFLFVTSDLESKIGLLEGYRNTEKGACNPAYLTIQSTVEYETRENLLRDTKRQSGARTILRLHWAMEFLSNLMLNLSKLSEDAETAPAAREAYSNTMAKHHPWTIRTIASFAMRTLPHKKTLVESVLGKDHIVSEADTNEKMLRLANATENLFNVVDKFYEENKIKDLP